MNLENVIQKIQKLSELTTDRGATPAEAAAAAAKIEELLEKHQLSMFDVKSRVYKETVQEEIAIEDSRHIYNWMYALARAVAEPHNCQYFSQKFWHDGLDKTCIKMVFIGHKSDALVARYLYEVLGRVLKEMADRTARRFGYERGGVIGFRNQFILAAAKEIKTRLEGERAVARTDVVTREASYQLVEVKNAVVVKYMEERYPDLVTVSRKGSSFTSDVAASEGAKAGRSVQLNKGISGTAGNSGLIGR